MSRRVFIVHGWGGSPEGDWLPWVQQKLIEKGYEVVVPRMPDTDNPQIVPWVDRITKVVGTPDKDTYFIGHSIGCQAILRYLATVLDTHVGGVVCVAPWFTLTGLETVEEQEIAKPWLTVPIDLEKVKNRTSNIVGIFSSNDPFVPLKENVAMFEVDLAGKALGAGAQGHFTEDDEITELPIVVETLEGMVQ